MSWPLVALADVAEIQGGIQKQPKRTARDNAFPFLRVANVTARGLALDEVHTIELFDGELERYRLLRGDLLVVEGNGSASQIGRAAVWDGSITDAVHQNHLIRVRPGFQIDPRFLGHLWNSPLIRDELSRVASSTSGLHTLSVTKLKRITLPLPSLTEQRRIVDLLEDHLSRLDAGRSEVERAAAKLAILRERTVIQALTGGAEANREDARLTDVSTADGDLSALPIGWSWSRLGDVADVVGGVTKDSKKQSDPNYVEVPYLRVANVQRGRLNLDEVTKIRVPQSKADALRLRPGDVLLNEGGDRDKLARGWVWEGQVPDCIHQNHVFRARITDPRIDPYFLSWTANTIGGRWAERNGKQSVNLASISLSMIRRMPVIVPPPGEAVRIATELRDSRSDFDRLEKSIRDGMDRALVLKKSLLTAAFSGRLTSSSNELLEELESV
uniref:Restriction modification system DNA specificity domain n=1 Tax=Mycolicibacterium gilvum (strain PYR-GCK) TaxID=350054 RepID=A4T8B4_MYCGI|nr:restriction modification system DNA specificity domain [Mycolicibacterium gilvum PYR-GCK]